jgi:hypothetical protein
MFLIEYKILYRVKDSIARFFRVGVGVAGGMGGWVGGWVGRGMGG